MVSKYRLWKLRFKWWRAMRQFHRKVEFMPSVLPFIWVSWIPEGTTGSVWVKAFPLQVWYGPDSRLEYGQAGNQDVHAKSLSKLAELVKEPGTQLVGWAVTDGWTQKALRIEFK